LSGVSKQAYINTHKVGRVDKKKRIYYVTNFAPQKVVLDKDIKVIVIQESLNFYSSLIDSNEYNRLKETKVFHYFNLKQYKTFWE